MTREQRIADARYKLEGIRLVIGPMQKQLEMAEAELRRAESSFEVGDRVTVTEEMCQRGCCNEYWDGVVVEVLPARYVNSLPRYHVKDVKTGKIHERNEHDFKRTK